MRHYKSIGLLIVATVGWVAAGCDDRELPHGSAPVVEPVVAAPAISEREFGELVGQPGVTLIKFGATWCPPCHRLDETLDSIASQLEPIARTRRIDTDQNPELAAQFDVSSIPHTFLFKDGQVVDDAVGAMSGREILAWVGKYQ